MSGGDRIFNIGRQEGLINNVAGDQHFTYAGGERRHRASSVSTFISYRRGDAPGHAGRLYDRLVDRFGEGHTFKDLDSLPAGADYVHVIEDTLKRCDVLLAVIGPRWIDAQRRLHTSGDWVRLEIATALQRGIRVIPVLVDGASMPSTVDLPDDLRALERRQAVALSESSWRAQLDRLLDDLERAPSGPSDGEALGRGQYA